jgi:Zinc finger, C3HC4 type (RING finger)
MEPTNEIIESIRSEEYVRLKCVKEGSKLRIKIISPGYASMANCQFPRDIRVVNRTYEVPRNDVSMADTKGKFFYRIKKNNIKIVEIISDNDAQLLSNNQKSNKKFDVTVYGDENIRECGICFDNVDDHANIVFVILVQCGHMVICDKCAYECKERSGKCPVCRTTISEIITKDQLQ